MVWLYLPESEVLISEYSSVFPHQEPCVSSRGKPMPPQSLERKWKKGGFIRLLSGLMLPPSTGDLLLERWITSQPGSHANLGVKPEKCKKHRMKDGSGKTLSELFAKFDQVSYSWKTCQVSLMGELTPFLGTWPQSGSMLNGVCSKRPKLVRTINVPDFSYSPIVPKEGVTFPTPSVMDSSQDGTMIRKVARESLARGGWRGIRLPLCVKLFPTPTTDCAQERTSKYQQGGTSLALAAQMMPIPDANPEKYRLKANSQSSKSLNALHGGKLNPQWVEWLMGWPIGWTDLERVEMELCHSKQPSPIPSSSKEQLKEVV